MNRFTLGNCWNFGKMILVDQQDFTGTWEELIELEEWTEFVSRHELTSLQIAYIHRGHAGLPFRDEPKGELFPFGAANVKNKPFDEVPLSYWLWVAKQNWVEEKYPTVWLHAQRVEKESKESQLTKEDVKTLLHTIA